MIGITGASGNLGSATAEHLAKRAEASRIVAIGRSESGVRKRTSSEVLVRSADYDEPSSLRGAFQGLDKLIFVPGAGTPAERRTQHDNVIDAAEQVGIKHFIYAGFIDNDAASPFWPAATIAYTEGRLAASGLAWTFLRNGVYAHFVGAAVEPARATGKYMTSARSGAACYASLPDLAEVAAVVATTDGHAGKAYRLTGERASEADVARILSRLVDKPVEVDLVEEQVVRERLGEMAVGIHRGILGGFFDRPSDDLARLLGRNPATIETGVGGAS